MWREVLTRNKDILIWSTNELHGLLRKDSHILIRSVVRNIFICTIVEGNEDVQKHCLQLDIIPSHRRGNNGHTDHDNEVEDIVKDNAEGERKVLEGLKLGALHDTIRHALNDGSGEGDRNIGVHLSHSNESLKETSQYHEKKGEKNQTLLHHNP